MSNMTRRQAADILLYEYGLIEKLKTIGCPHIVGSYRMDMMAWNDLDIDIENDAMSKDRLYELTQFILATFKPTWYEAKEEINNDGKTVWFHGFETMITGELWNVDLWFFDKPSIEQAEQYCDEIIQKGTPEQKQAILDIKTALIERGLYSFDQYTSMDVYTAVLDNGVMNVDGFLNTKEG